MIISFWRKWKNFYLRLLVLNLLTAHWTSMGNYYLVFWLNLGVLMNVQLYCHLRGSDFEKKRVNTTYRHNVSQHIDCMLTIIRLYKLLIPRKVLKTLHFRKEIHLAMRSLENFCVLVMCGISLCDNNLQLLAEVTSSTTACDGRLHTTKCD